MSRRTQFIKKITNITGVALILLGAIPTPALAQAVPAERALVGAAAIGLQIATSYTELLGGEQLVSESVDSNLELPQISGKQGDWLVTLITEPLLMCEGDDCTPEPTQEPTDQPSEAQTEEPVQEPAEEPAAGEAGEEEVLPEEAPTAEGPEGEDLCPQDENKVEPGICGCGIPDIDSDGDGKKDCEDDCPLDAANTCMDATAEVPAEPVDEAEDDSVAEEVVALAEAGLVVVNDNDEVVSLASNEAAEIIEVADPYFTIGTTTYRFFSTAGACTAYPGDVCYDGLDNPIQYALTEIETVGMPTDETLYVETGTYYNQVVVPATIADLTITSVTGNTPILDGSLFPDAEYTIGFNVYGDNITINGFTIQYFDVGIALNASGNAKFTATNNVFKHNKRAIDNVNSVPSVDIHYNEFEDNDIAIWNTVAGGAQFLDARDNYWGCAGGPIVKREVVTCEHGNSDCTTSYEYYWWATETLITDYDPNESPYVGCQLVYGDKHWDMHMGSALPWAPYKILLGSTTLCGNNRIDEGEQCDGTAMPSGVPDGVICNEDCTLPSYCGDGITDPALGETCDGEPYCRDDCTYCGDGVWEWAIEACEYGSGPGGDGYNPDCRDDCTIAQCGDGILDTALGETCDPAITDTQDPGYDANCRQDCTIPTCGDGILDTALGEACDPAITDTQDPGYDANCRQDCTIPTCGDGITDTALGETCDGQAYCRENCTFCGDDVLQDQDGETCDGDEYCRADCTYCGDAIVNGEETCDPAIEAQDYCNEECEYKEFAPLELSVSCAGVSTLGWKVKNPNNFSVPNVVVLVGVDPRFDGTFPAGATVSMGTTADGPALHTMIVMWPIENFAQITSTEVCEPEIIPPPLPIPVTGEDIIIPVTGADILGAMIEQQRILVTAGTALLGISLMIGGKKKKR